MKSELMYKKETIYLSQLANIDILWPGDMRELAEFTLRCCEAKDKIANAKNRGTTQKTCPTLHGIACDFAQLADIPCSKIETMLKDMGFNLGSSVDFDVIKTVPAGK